MVPKNSSEDASVFTKTKLLIQESSSELDVGINTSSFLKTKVWARDGRGAPLSGPLFWRMPLILNIDTLRAYCGVEG